MYKLRSRGFTLIELLVVIAIIGILSAVVLASLNVARKKGSDAAVMSDLDGIRTEAEVYYDGAGGNSYGTQAWATSLASCTGGMFGDPTIVNQLKGANGANGGASIGCAAAGTTYVVAAQLVNNPGTYWCVDETGKSELVTAVFPASLATCP